MAQGVSGYRRADRYSRRALRLPADPAGDEGSAVLLVAPTGLGKTHRARSLVQAALVARRRALFVDAMDALDQLAAARAAGRLRPALQHQDARTTLCRVPRSGMPLGTATMMVIR